ncbi:MAG: hypothetical protein WCC64_14635 [Aliidongia sp.]
MKQDIEEGEWGFSQCRQGQSNGLRVKEMLFIAPVSGEERKAPDPPSHSQYLVASRVQECAMIRRWIPGWSQLSLSLAILMSISWAYAATDEMKIGEEILNIEGIEKIEVVIVPPTITNPEGVASPLSTEGCKFITKDLFRMHNLVETLENADLKRSDDRVYRWVNVPRESITLTVSGENKISFVFEPKYSNQDLVHGYFVQTTDKTHKWKQSNITANGSFVNELTLWAIGVSDAGSVTGSNSCKYFQLREGKPK